MLLLSKNDEEKYLWHFLLSDKVFTNAMLSDTDYGRMMAISQILYSQYHIWVRFEKQSY